MKPFPLTDFSFYRQTVARLTSQEWHVLHRNHGHQDDSREEDNLRMHGEPPLESYSSKSTRFVQSTGKKNKPSTCNHLRPTSVGVMRGHETRIPTRLEDPVHSPPQGKQKLDNSLHYQTIVILSCHSS